MGLQIDECINNAYYIRSTIDDGGEGVVYAARDKDGQEYAVKVGRGPRSLRREYRAYTRLGCTKRDRHFLPRIYYYSTHEGQSLMVMNRFETSLEDLRQKNRGSFSMSTVLKIGSKVVRMLAYVHSKGTLHGDVKPSNIMLRRERNRLAKFHLIDFGCSHSYLLDDSRHVSDSKGSFYGTTLFAPPRAHERKVQSRRDDLKSLTYVLVYLVKGTLPWKHFNESETGRMKNNISFDELCSGTRGLLDFANKIWKLSFEEKPDYESLVRILESALIEFKRTIHIRYDWE